MKQKKNPSAEQTRYKYDTTRAWVRAIELPIIAFVLTLIVESFNRAGVGSMFSYLITHPVYFLINVLIILATLTFSELFRRRKSALLLISVIWLALGIAAYLVADQRTQPFTFMDIMMLQDAITLTTIYFTWPRIIGMCVAIFAALVIIVNIFKRLSRRRHVDYARSIILVAGMIIACFCVEAVGISTGNYPRYFDNLVDAYDQYGFATCFTYAFGGFGISEPSEYSTEAVASIVESAEETVEEASGDEAASAHVFNEDDNLAQPNIIYVQLESFFDVNTIIGSSYSFDPTPNFNELCENYPNGELYVPSVGGATVNVEFEILTGMNIDFFASGEYPYSTVLLDNTVESIAYNLLEQGYSTTAMHNHTATFYNRNKVYANLGFEHFVPLEYMPYVTYTDVGWAEDIVMADEIIKALDASEERDFIMTVTVESHGKYETTYTYQDGDPEEIELPDQIDVAAFSNYLRLIHETDKFVGELIDKLEDYDEPVICVFYGDHLPALSLTADILTTGNLYASHYVIWNNFGADLEAPDLQAYQLSANLLGQLGMSGGVITKYHQSSDLTDTDNQEYLDNLELLEYDLIYGDKSSYEDGVSPYDPIDLMLGSVPIVITEVSQNYGRLLVEGENFTEYSAILIDGVKYDTAFISDTQIITILPKTTQVGQVEDRKYTTAGDELGRTDAYIVDEDVVAALESSS